MLKTTLKKEYKVIKNVNEPLIYFKLNLECKTYLQTFNYFCLLYVKEY